MESVKQRIADLESAGKVVGGLSLSSEFELACLRELVAVTEQRDALVVEAAALKAFGDKLSDMHNDLNGEGTGIQGRAEVACQQIALEAAMEEFDAIETPAADAAIAALRADAGATAIEQFALLMRSPGDDPFLDAVAEGVAGAADNFARQLRESKGEVSNG